MQVKETKNYEMFSTIGGNRPKNQLHLSRLKKSMEEQLLISPIIVNEKYQVIDGQHRLQVSSELNLPVRYIVCDGYGLSEVHRLNENSKNWSMRDFIDGYAELGNKEYIYLLDFMERNDIGLSASLALLSNDSGHKAKSVKNGTFKVEYKKRGDIVADWVNIIKNYNDRALTQIFVRALVKLYNNSEFEFSQLISKIAQQPTALVPCVNVEQYLTLLEDIYNYRSRNKVNLRY
jgi:hypothetical protein